jgi:hypothetical protein
MLIVIQDRNPMLDFSQSLLGLGHRMYLAVRAIITNGNVLNDRLDASL